MGTPVIIQQPNRGPSLLTTVIWFIFIGWWASLAWVVLAWLLFLPIVTLPIGLAMMHHVPKIATLRDATRELKAATEGAVTILKETDLPQRPVWLRALYFLFIGSWFSLLWALGAWLLSLSLIGIPGAIWMYNRIPAVTTLKRY